MEMRRLYVILDNGNNKDNYAAEIVFKRSNDGSISSARGRGYRNCVSVATDHAQAITKFLSNPTVVPIRRLPPNLAVTAINIPHARMALTIQKEISEAGWDEAHRIGLLKNGKPQFSFFMLRCRKSPLKSRKNMEITHDKIIIYYTRVDRHGMANGAQKTFPITQYKRAIKFYERHRADKATEAMKVGQEIQRRLWAAETKVDAEAKVWKNKRMKEIRRKFATETREALKKVMAK
jgi:hypothetical protein